MISSVALPRHVKPHSLYPWFLMVYWVEDLIQRKEFGCPMVSLFFTPSLRKFKPSIGGPLIHREGIQLLKNVGIWFLVLFCFSWWGLKISKLCWIRARYRICGNAGTRYPYLTSFFYCPTWGSNMKKMTHENRYFHSIYPAHFREWGTAH